MATTPTPQENTPTPKQATPLTKKVNPTPVPQKTVVTQQGISQEVIDQLSRDVNIMLSFAAKNGIAINTEVNPLIQNSSIDDLINAYNLLCVNVAPATPKSIENTRKININGDNKSLFNRIPLVRNLIILTILFLISYISFGYFPEVNNDSLDKGVMSNSGISLLLNLGYLASISGLGVLFHLLKKISVSVEKSTLVPEESINYIAQILLGIIAGLLLSEVLASYITDPNDINLFNKSILALIGGFSSDAIFSILEGLITRIKSIFIPVSQPK
tara:strand:- start:9957 stop:10775 length:819 start_codon:yes stop_codon:yes gene_type:complete